MPNKTVSIDRKTHTLYWSDEELDDIRFSTFTKYKRLFAETLMEPEDGEYLCEECEYRQENYNDNDSNFGHHPYCPILGDILEYKLYETDEDETDET